MKLPALHTIANTYDPGGKYEYIHLKDGFAWVTDKLMMVKYRLPDELSAVTGRIHFDQWRVISKHNVVEFTPIGADLHALVNSENSLSIVLDLLPLDEGIEKMELLYDRTVQEVPMIHCVVDSEMLTQALRLIGEDSVTIKATEKSVIILHEEYTILIAQIQRQPHAPL